MKKTFILSLIAGASFSFAQISVASNPSNLVAAPSTLQEDGISAVIFDQPASANSGLVSDYFNELGGGVYAADDFDLTESSQITSVTTYGFQNNQTLTDLMTGFRLYIFADNDFIPGGIPETNDNAIHFFDIDLPNDALTITQDGILVTFDIDLVTLGGVVLPEGKYWLSFAPKMQMSNTDGNTRWNWYYSNGQANGEGQLVDPNDLFGAGLTDWTSTSTIGLDYDAFAFTLMGFPDDTASVDDLNAKKTMVVYPNPSNNVVNIQLNKGLELQSAQLLDINGRVVKNTKTSSVDVSSLAPGVYILRATTTNGKTSQTKVVVK